MQQLADMRDDTMGICHELTLWLRYPLCSTVIMICPSDQLNGINLKERMVDKEDSPSMLAIAARCFRHRSLGAYPIEGCGLKLHAKWCCSSTGLLSG